MQLKFCFLGGETTSFLGSNPSGTVHNGIHFFKNVNFYVYSSSHWHFTMKLCWSLVACLQAMAWLNEKYPNQNEQLWEKFYNWALFQVL